MSLSEQIQRVDGSQNDIIKALAQSYGISTDGLKIDQVASAVKSSQKFKQDGLFSAATAALFGLGSDAVPDDCFAYLGKYAQYWWKRSKSTTVWYADIVSGGTNRKNITTASSASATTDIRYSETSAGREPWTPVDPLDSGWCCVAYCPVDSKDAIAVTGPYRVQINRDSLDIKSRVDTVSEYVQSSDRNAYPDSGEQDGYEYEYLGVPFDNAVNAPKIETGSYVGTGTYGADNPNSLTFGFEPKFFICISSMGKSFLSSSSDGTMWVYGFTYGGNYNTPTFSLSENTLRWYSDTVGPQLNKEGNTYFYAAIG